MNKMLQIFFKQKVIILTSMAFTLSGCPLNVNLNIATDKPISLAVDKPLEVKLDAGVAVTELAPIKVTTLPPVKVGIAPNTKKNNLRYPTFASERLESFRWPFGITGENEDERTRKTWFGILFQTSHTHQAKT